MMVKPDHHDEVELNLLPHGSLTYLMGGRRVTVHARRLVMFWAAIPHQVVSLETDNPYYVATIPFSWFLQSGLSKSDVQALLNGKVYQEVDESRFLLDEFQFKQWISDLENDFNDLKRETTFLELKARMHRLLFNVANKQQDPIPKDHLGPNKLRKVEKIACFIAKNYTRSLRVKEIADQVNLHPNHTMHLFKEGFGSTISDYLTYHRISHAQRLLVTTQLKMVDVCFESGFGSLSQFNNVFKSRNGCTPKDYREKHANIQTYSKK